MSLIPHYVRADPATIRLICADQDKALNADTRPYGTEMIIVDQAHIALSWLISPLQRAEHAYLGRLVADPDWPDEEIDACRVEMDAMQIEDALAAIMGWTGKMIAAGQAKVSAGAYYFAPERIACLSAALAAINEANLRAELDFEALDKGFVPPDGWIEDGEEIFVSYILPTLDKLQTFYRAAARARQAVLIIIA